MEKQPTSVADPSGLEKIIQQHADNFEKIQEVCAEKKRRLDELMKLPRGDRFFHHTIMPRRGETDLNRLANLLKNGIYDRKVHQSDFKDLPSWTYKGGVSVFTDSEHSFHVYDDESGAGITLLIDPKAIQKEKRSWQANDVFALHGEHAVDGLSLIHI